MIHSRQNRRQFVATIAATSIAALPINVNASEDDNPPFKISIAPWSLMRRVAGHEDPGGVDLWSYPKVVRELGFEGIEHDNLHFPGELPKEKMIARMRKACDDEGLKSTLILCGGLGDIADGDKNKREAAIGNYRAWADAAKTLDCGAIRVVCADRKTELSFDEKRRHAVEGIRTLAEKIAKLELDLLIENHGGYSSDPRWLTRVVKEVNRTNCGILADFTHWSVDRKPEKNVIDPYEGMKLLAPLTRSVSAHAYDFGTDGTEKNWDYRRMLSILMSAGFDGYVAVEYFGKSLGRKEGSRKSMELLQQMRHELLSAH